MKRLLLLALLVLFLPARAENGARYLVICPDAMRAAIDPLARWRQATGISTKVVPLSLIGNDTTAIRSYISVAYASWPVKPDYVLLVGDGATLPARLYKWHGYVYCSSDNIYADMGGDYEAELAVGRFPASTPAELEVMVAKTLKYEKDPDLTDSLWMRKLTTVVREGGSSDDTIYWGNIRNAARKAHDAGFVNCDSLSYERGHTSADVMNSLNRGTGLVLYRGTAGGNWPDPFDQVSPDAITATNKLPIVCSITCQTMSLSPYEEMLGEQWLLSGDLGDLYGGVAFFGNTHADDQVARQRGAIARGFFDGLFDDNVWQLGRTAKRAKHQLHAEFPADTYDYRGFSLYGDPALGIWTATPRPPTVLHPPSIPPGPQQLVVTVDWAGTPIENALVCASMDTFVYSYAYTDTLGQVALSITVPDTGSLRLVVTGKNVYPYDTLIPVVQTGVSDQTPVPFRGPVTLAASPSPCREAMRISLSPVAPRLSPLALSFYNASGRLVLSQPVLTSPFPLSTSSFPSGVYLAVLRDRSGRALGRTRITKLN
ncbi:MAG: C25 family cysteine peptidase [candidate division WOR-3 bacterium]|nr:C25 family cysteine peptidase [candidate division WOR-3 bacterium]